MISFRPTLPFLVVLVTLLLTVFSAGAAEPRYTVNLKDWPADMVNKIYSTVPALRSREMSADELNAALKKLDEKFNFNSLKLLKQEGSSALLLVGEISPEVKVRFEGLSELTEQEAISTMSLTPTTLLDEDSLKAGVLKLASFYREQGYRSAQVQYEIISESTLVKMLVFRINRKKQTYLNRIVIEGLSDQKFVQTLDQIFKRKFHKADLTQDTLNKVAQELRTRLSSYGYYTLTVPSPQIQFTADELSARVIYRLTEAQRYRIEVKNSFAYTNDTLEEDVLKLSTYYSRDPNSMGPDLAEILKAYYISKGYPHISVLVNETKIENRQHIYLNVEEGPYTKISDFKVIGQISRPEKFYKDKFFELASADVQNKMFLKEDIEIAAKNLMIYLQNDGFVNAKMSRLFVNTDREKPEIGVVILQIEEGPQVKIGTLNYTGVSPQNLEGVKLASQLIEGQKLSLVALELAVQNMKTYYQQQGYIEYKLLNETKDLISYNESNETADLHFKIVEGPRVVVASIDVQGNTRTKTKMVLLELDFQEGDILTPDQIEESVARLQRTGYFNLVEISTLEKDTDVSNRTVIVKVTERDPGQRVLGIGITDENRGTLHGYAGVAYRNFWGRGVGLSLRGEANYNFARIRFLEQKYTLGGFWPYIFDTRVRFRTTATRSTTISDISINKVTEANTAIFSLEQDFTSHITGQISYAVNTFYDHGITNEDEIIFGYTSESLVIGSIGPAIDVDYRDNIFNPTSGHYSRLAYEHAPEGMGNNNVDSFYRVTAETTFYLPLQSMVFAQSLRGGYIKVTGDNDEGVPFDKRGFTLGGRSTIRGFEAAEFFPSTDEIGASYRLTTSSHYELVKSELRFPISTKYDLAGAVFYDGGRVEIENLPLADKWRDAAGIGIRYNTPIGPLSLEYGHKLDKKTGESDGAFHLSFGVF